MNGLAEIVSLLPKLMSGKLSLNDLGLRDFLINAENTQQQFYEDTFTFVITQGKLTGQTISEDGLITQRFFDAEAKIRIIDVGDFLTNSIKNSKKG